LFPNKIVRPKTFVLGSSIYWRHWRCVKKAKNLNFLECFFFHQNLHYWKSILWLFLFHLKGDVVHQGRLQICSPVNEEQGCRRRRQRETSSQLFQTQLEGPSQFRVLRWSFPDQHRRVLAEQHPQAGKQLSWKNEIFLRWEFPFHNVFLYIAKLRNEQENS